MKQCTKCGETKPLSEYHNNGPNKLRPDCKVCLRARVKKARTPEKEEEYQARRFYGLSLDEARTLWHADKCEICGSPDPNDRRRKFHIDHCHTTGAVRGALCANCNRGLGDFKDNPDVLRKAAEYLERSRCETA